MSPANTHARLAGLAATVCLGGLLLLVHVSHALGEGETGLTILLGSVAPAILACAILAGGVWLWRSDLDGGDVLRIGLWCLVGAAVLAGGAGMTILFEQAKGVFVADRAVIVANAASGGGVAGLVVGIYDVRQRRASRRARRREQQLTVLNRVLRHDIRNEANVIWGRAEILAEETDGGSEHVRTISDHAAGLVELGDRAKVIERLLRPEDVEAVTVDVATVVESSIEHLRSGYPDVEVDATLPAGIRVRAHPLLESAIANVMDNAVTHNDADVPRIEVSLERIRRDGTAYVDLQVADNGPGIPSSEVDVMERGYESPLAHSGGLGLWLVNWLVTAADGEVDIESNGGRGSVVHLLLVSDGDV